uniref:C-type lectin domain-containing protein n=1 Tax=Panagrolaimus davidi TaxID=227884 RepID=A0A914QHH9_9BILA
MPGYNCVGIKLQGGMWDAVDCDNLKPSVCIIKISVLTTTTTTLKPKICPASWVYYDVTGFCYLVVNKATKWSDAEDWCFSQGGHLASIHSQAENNFVTSIYYVYS